LNLAQKIHRSNVLKNSVQKTERKNMAIFQNYDLQVKRKQLLIPAASLNLIKQNFASMKHVMSDSKCKLEKQTLKIQNPLCCSWKIRFRRHF
jgi:ethanolamine utilization cobalamin adenosyltransferase